ncbi:hypothetical protein FOXYS1_12454 [Fusarium oxysporum]|uniref:U3 small nucleolar RNA-associated protein 15 C-terminal domain-containing protein n=1 Tax=Fusarium oxysporum TaxID=5507 RepID=A0A8H5EDP0_FUSOX|nr:hypothetical protein FOXYS1_12454 [Fusarium oxysporum]
MAAQVGPLPQLKLPSGPTPITAEQRYWKTFKNQLLIPSPTSYPVVHISANNDSFAVTTGTRIQIYSNRTRKLQKTITRFGDVARSGEIRKDGRVLAAGDDTGKIQVFDVNSRAILKTWTQHKQPVWTTKFSPTELTTLLSASDDRTVRLWDLPSNDPTTTFVGHSDYVRCANFMPGTMSNMIVSGSYDSTVKLWDPRAGSNSAVMTFKHAAPIEDVLSMPTGTAVLAAAGESISVLDLVAARPLHMITNHQKTVTSLSLATNGRRLVSGGLEGHVKVFETTGWNVVSSTKYQSPVLSVKVIPSSDDADSSDRHLAVGMQSGVLSVRTRLTGAEANREAEREKEMAALVAGTIEAHDAKRKKRKRRVTAAKKLDMVGEGADVVIANESRTYKKKERPWQSDLRHARYARALDQVLDKDSPEHSPLNVLTLLLALRHRSALQDALESRDEHTVQPILKWVCSHICDPRYVSVCVEVGLHLLELYAEFVGGSAELHEGFRTLHRRVRVEVERAQVACQTGGARKKEDDDDRVADLEASIDQQCVRSFITHAARPNYRLTATPSAAAAAASAEFAGKPPSLALQTGALSTGTESNIALYYVATARQTNWPPGLVKPHVDLKTGRYTVRPVGSLRNFLNRLFITGYYDKQLKQYVRGSIAIPDYTGVGINMYTMPDASTVMIECDTVTHNFQKEPAKVNFHENFLGLARAYKECEFDGEVARLVETLQDVPAGYAFCTGGLGSGKTTTVHNIVKAILFGTVENIDISDPDAEQWETSEAPADAIPQYEVVPTPSGANLECGMYAIVKSMSHQLPDHAPSIDDLRDLLNGPEMTERMAPLFDIGQSNLTADQIAAVLQLWGDQRGIVLRLNVIVEGDQLQVIFPTDDCTTIWIHNDNAVELSGTDFNHYSGVKLAAATSPSTELDLAQQVLQSLTHIQGMVSVPALDVDEEAAAPLTEYEEPELGEYKKAEGFVSAKDTAGNSFDQSSNKPRVAWIAAQNKVVDDAAHCAFLQCLTRQFRVE